MQRENKEWLHYVSNIIASDMTSAVFLASYLRFLRSGGHFISNLEVVDLQRYKVIRQKRKVQAALANRVHIPFVFAVSKN